MCQACKWFYNGIHDYVSDVPPFHVLSGNYYSDNLCQQTITSTNDFVSSAFLAVLQIKLSELYSKHLGREMKRTYIEIGGSQYF